MSTAQPDCVIVGAGGNVDISEHIGHLGDVVTVSLTSTAEYGGIVTADPQPTGGPGNLLGCTTPSYSGGKLNGAIRCRYKVVYATGSWEVLNWYFSVAYGGASQNGTFFASISDSAIDGTVTRRARAEDKTSATFVPAVGARVKIGSRPAVTDARGYYFQEINAAGDYPVSAAGYCVKGGAGACRQSKTVKVPHGGTVDFAEGKATGLGISGEVDGQACGEDSCRLPKGVQGVTVLVTGKRASDGSDVTVKDVTGKDGHWSVEVPKGSYTAGPTLDGKTFVGPSFTPDEKKVDVGAKEVKGVNFMSCVVQAGAARSTSAARTGSRAAAGSPVERCISHYTLTIKASIPQPVLVDPSPAAHYNVSPNSSYGSNGYNDGAEGWIPFVKRSTERKALKLAPELPECMDQSTAASLTDRISKGKASIRWYSFIQGGTELGTFKVPFSWNQSTQEVHLLRGLAEQPVKVTREFRWEVTDARGNKKTGHCGDPTAADLLLLPVAGGDAAEGTVPKTGFTVIALWVFPFDPFGVKVDPAFAGSTLTRSISEATAKELSELYEKFESLPAIVKFGAEFIRNYCLFSGVIKAVQLGPAAVAGLFGGLLEPGTVKLVEGFATVLERLHQAHSAGEVLGFLTQSFLGSEELSPDEYPVMAAVIRGQFKTSKKIENLSSGEVIPVETWLGMSFVSGGLPSVAVTVKRQSQTSDGNLPWKTGFEKDLTTYNPFFSGHPTNFFNVSAKAQYLSGKAAIEALQSDNANMLPVARALRQSGSLGGDLFGQEQALAPRPRCNDKDGTTESGKTICWLFTDGRP